MDLPGNLIADTEMTDCQNVFFEKGHIKKRYGYSELGDNLPLPGSVIGSDQLYLFSGSDYLLAMTTCGVWKYDATNDYWDTIMTTEQEDDCETTWTAKANVTVADDSTAGNYKEGTASQKISPDANFTTGVMAYRNQVLGDKSGYGLVCLWIKSSIAQSAGALEFIISNDANCATETENIDIPALAANTWKLAFITIATPSGISSVDSLGLKATSDFGACDIYIDDIEFVEVFSSDVTYDSDDTDICSYDYIRDTTQTEPWWIMTNCVDSMWKWTGDGALAALISDYPSGVTSLTCRDLIEFKDHLLLLDVTEEGDRYPQRVRWSDTADPTDFLNGNASYVDLGGADWIQTAAKFKGDYVVVFKERSIWVGYATGDSDIFQFDQRVTGAGCAAPRTVESLGDELVFLGWDDVYVFNGIDYESIGSPIQRELFDTMDPGAIDKCFGVIVEEQKEYWLFVPSTGSDYCDIAWVFNYELNKWTKHDFADVDGTTNGISAYGYYEKQSSVTFDSLSGTFDAQTWRFDDREVLEAAPTTLFGDTDGYVYEYDQLVSNDDGTTIDGWFSTKDFMFTQLMERQVILRLDVYADGNMDVCYSTDSGTTWSDAASITCSSYAIQRIWWRVDCGTIRFRFRNNTSGEHFDFREARIYWEPSGIRL